MNPRALGTLGLLALAVAFAGMADQAVWSDAVFGSHYPETNRVSYTLASVASIAGMLGTAALAIKLGARRTAIVGLGVAAAGVVLAMLGSTYIGSFLAPFGLGAFRPCVLGAAAGIVAEQRLGRLRFLAMSAAALACSAASDPSWMIGREMMERAKLRTTTDAGGFVLVLFALGAVCIYMSGRGSDGPAPVTMPVQAPYRVAQSPADEPPAISPPGPRALRTVFAVLLPVMLLANIAYRFEVVFTMGAVGSLSSALPYVRFVVTIGTAGAFVAAVRRGELWPPLTLWAVALVVFGMGLFGMQWAERGSSAAFPTFAVALVGAIATPFMWSLPQSYVTLAVPPRLATTTLAAWTVGVNLALWPLSFVVQAFGTGPLSFVCAASLISAGIYVLKRRHDLHHRLSE